MSGKRRGCETNRLTNIVRDEQGALQKSSTATWEKERTGTTSTTISTSTTRTTTKTTTTTTTSTSTSTTSITNPHHSHHQRDIKPLRRPKRPGCHKWQNLQLFEGACSREHQSQACYVFPPCFRSVPGPNFQTRKLPRAEASHRCRPDWGPILRWRHGVSTDKQTTGKLYELFCKEYGPTDNILHSIAALCTLDTEEKHAKESLDSSHPLRLWPTDLRHRRHEVAQQPQPFSSCELSQYPSSPFEAESSLVHCKSRNLGASQDSARHCDATEPRCQRSYDVPHDSRWLHAHFHVYHALWVRF